MTPEEKEQPPASPRRPEIAYPCTWVYKVIGTDCTLLKDAITTACSPYPVNIGYSHSSSKGKYHSLNAELFVADETVRLKIYEALRNSSVVNIVL